VEPQSTAETGVEWALRMIFGQRLKNVADGGEIWDLALLWREILGGKPLGDLVLAMHNNPGGADLRNLGHCVEPSKTAHLERYAAQATSGGNSSRLSTCVLT
jgi:hypothetical protein